MFASDRRPDGKMAPRIRRLSFAMACCVEDRSSCPSIEGPSTLLFCSLLERVVCSTKIISCHMPSRWRERRRRLGLASGFLLLSRRLDFGQEGAQIESALKRARAMRAHLVHYRVVDARSVLASAMMLLSTRPLKIFSRSSAEPTPIRSKTIESMRGSVAIALFRYFSVNWL